MDAANAAGGKDFDAGPMRNPDGGGYSRRAVPPVRYGDGQIACADLLNSSLVAIRLICSRRTNVKSASRMAMVAGAAPASRTICSSRSAVSRF